MHTNQKLNIINNLTSKWPNKKLKKLNYKYVDMQKIFALTIINMYIYQEIV
jgi:hypothetical protein